MHELGTKIAHTMTSEVLPPSKKMVEKVNNVIVIHVGAFWLLYATPTEGSRDLHFSCASYKTSENLMTSVSHLVLLLAVCIAYPVLSKTIITQLAKKNK